MDLVMFGLVFAIGFIASRLVYGGRRAGPFEESLMANLAMGKKVIVTIDEECYIFEMYGKRMRITRGIATFSEEPYVVESDNLVNINTDQSGDNTQVGG